MSFQLRNLRLSVVTDGGRYGRSLEFKNGLNILRAENASGKSTCTQAVIYALGLEAMLSAKHAVPLPHAMKDWLETEDGKRLEVLESHVLLEIENAAGKRLAIQRCVKGTQDNHLVTVWEGPKLSSPGVDLVATDYFVRQTGAASRERGFHKFLADFIGISLPEVQKYDGGRSQLYLECIFPLMLVEQKKGWSGIQAAMPLQFQIKDVRKRAIEFVLALDSHDLAQRRLQIEKEKSDLRREWGIAINHLRDKAKLIGCKFSDLPADPVPAWPPEIYPSLWFIEAEGDIPLQKKLDALRFELHELESSKIPSVQEDADRLNAQLREKSDDLAALNLAISEMELSFSGDRADRTRLEAQIANLNEDIAHHNDLLRLRRMGSTEKLTISSGHCPTCHQEIQDVLLPQDEDYNALSIEESLNFLKGQRETFQAMQREVTASIADKAARLEKYRDKAASIRSEIRTIKSALITDARLPSEAALERRVWLRSEIARLSSTSDEISVLLDLMDGIATRWADVLTREKKLPTGSISPSDSQKLTALKDSVCGQLVKYGLKSFDPAEFDISQDSYLPIYGNFDLSFDMSASDLIRLVWAYLLGLLEVARTFPNNHTGFVFFDEPQQQNVKDLSFSALLQRAYLTKGFNQQVVVSISKLPPDFATIIPEADRHLIDIHDKWMLIPE